MLSTYRGGVHLEEQLESIRAQTRPADYLLRREDADPHVGSTRSYERLLARAVDADVVVLCDQDDVWMPTKLDRLEAALRGDALLAYSDGTLINGAGEPLPGSIFERFGRTDDPLISVFTRPCIPGCTVALRGSVLQHALPFPDALEDADLRHDGWLIAVAAALGDVVRVDERLIAYRLHDAQQVGLRRSDVRRRLSRLSQRTTSDLQRRARGMALLRARLGDVPQLDALAAFTDARLGARFRREIWRHRADYAHYDNGWWSVVSDLLR